MKIRKLFILLLLQFSIFSIFGTSYIVSDYKIETSGKTKIYALQTLLNDKTRFNSKEELEAFISEKKQELINLRLFKMVNVKYEESAERVSGNDLVYVTIVCDVTESSSLLVMPYPKYDSNTGFSLGLKIKENNLFGTLAQFNGSLELITNGLSILPSLIRFDLPVTDFPMLDGISSFSISGEFNFKNPENNNVNYSFSLKELEKLNAVFTLKSEGSFYFHTLEKSFITVEALMEDFDLGSDYKIDSSAFIKIRPYNFKIEESKVLFKIGNKEQGFKIETSIIPNSDYFWGSKSYIELYAFLDKDLHINAPSNLKTNAKFKISPYKDEVYNLKPDTLETDVIFSSDSTLEIRSQVMVDFMDKHYNTKSSIGFTAFDFFQPRGIIKTYASDDMVNIKRIDLDFDLSATFSFFSEKLNFYPEITVYDILNYVSSDITKSNTFIEFMFLANYSGGEINYYSSYLPYWTFRDNFRVGYKYGVESAFRYTTSKDVKFFFRGYAEGFFKIGNYFNPSIRLLASATSSPTVWFNQEKDSDYKLISDSDSDYYYKFNAYSFGDFTFVPNTLNEILRGIRLDNKDVETGGPASYMTLTGNINLVYGLINFEDFAHIYIYPFYDFALFVNPLKYLHSVGVEMVGIMDSHPSYPIRMSLGFNMDTLIDKIKGSDNPLEYEVFIGLGWLF